ncbi:gluconokinase [Dokdonia sinensis]|uniref:Gluconokinase n=1 Tax=Dokdonia sinensis TaxID=2479847 RepID=A0A3M0FZ31_9FLAO|nr:gluconokinase [Dokdonia sinensis]RMB57678.1 gluconokinase [Dokdonia sinensis]
MGQVFVIMGVSGSGKTTIGQLVAQELNIPFYDADDYHPQANINKMASGRPLNDEDRWPWLSILARNIQEWNRNGGAVLACSALKEVYRERLFKEESAFAKAKKNFIYLQADFETIKSRLAQRENHFFDPELLQSQFDTLEEPEYGVVVDGKLEKEIIVECIVMSLEP